MKELYAVVFMDAIHYHIRSEGVIVKRAIYIALGIDMDGLSIFPQAIEAMYPQSCNGYMAPFKKCNSYTKEY